MINVVVKVGGSLSRGTNLRALCLLLAQLGCEHRILVVPGGGPFADTVRDCDKMYGLSDDASHWMAILAMDQYGYLLLELIPGSEPARERHEARRIALSGKVPVLIPFELLRRTDPLPHSWAVTSDSISAWVARSVGASKLILLKSLDGLSDGVFSPGALEGESYRPVTLEQLARWEGVDPYLAAVLANEGPELWIIDGNMPDRFRELLAKGTTPGLCLQR